MIQTTKQFLFKFRMCNDTLQAILLKKNICLPKGPAIGPPTSSQAAGFPIHPRIRDDWHGNCEDPLARFTIRIKYNKSENVGLLRLPCCLINPIYPIYSIYLIYRNSRHNLSIHPFIRPSSIHQSIYPLVN